MQRDIFPLILKDLSKKLILLTGPRQCGKTTLAKQLKDSYDYLNYDAVEDRQILAKKAWDRQKDVLIFDELHKMRRWKQWLKGVYDKEGLNPPIIVTGSAQLNTYRKVGDSLAGRYFQFRLHPFCLKEVSHHFSEDISVLFNRLWQCGGFPEPFLQNDVQYYKRWRRSHLDIILRQDLLDLYAIRDIKSIETLVELLKTRVGSTVSYANLARDLERDANTVKRWLQLLEELYIVFRVRPYHQNITRSLLKEPKYYFYDFAQIEGDDGARLENLVACALLRELHYWEDMTGDSTALHFLRTKEGKEIDFLVVINHKPYCMIEVKWSDPNPSPAFTYFQPSLSGISCVQLVRELKREATYPNGVAVRDLVQWLAHWSLDPS
ncbi:MAG: ATPase [Gammaproteobacteria bacterium RIFCSPHIGHO2_12_FULL_45_9]|nr:MAG: ATPase [Gammaproteobacteria bacterium RIFCSPHIGHO2_12_FULL_45_9]